MVIKDNTIDGFGMGIAVHRSFLTYVATVVQAEVKDGQVVVKRVDTALDAGTVVNPTIARQQFEGAAVMGTSEEAARRNVFEGLKRLRTEYAR